MLLCISLCVKAFASYHQYCAFEYHCVYNVKKKLV